MGYKILQRAAKFIAEQRSQRRWYKAVSFMGAVVVFITTYALILPAITMERDTICGLEVHVHTDDCYTTELVKSEKELICTYETLNIHKHTADCKDDEGKLICGYADFVVHTHDEHCYNTAGDLICTLPEIEEHSHDDSCYQEDDILICEEEEDPGHIHSKDCYTPKKGELICDQEDGDDHKHDESCYEWIDELTCGKEENQEGHVHTDDCYDTEQTLDCDKEEVHLHKHTEKCYDEEGNLICGMLEVLEHQHTEDCFQQPENEFTEVQVLTCEKEEHTHTDSCYPDDGESSDGVVKDGEDKEEESKVDENKKEYPCGLEEHDHSADCYDEQGNLICGLPKHTHSEECFQAEIPQEYVLSATTPEGVTVVLTGSSISFTVPLNELTLTVDELSLEEGDPPPAGKDVAALMDGLEDAGSSMTEDQQSERARAAAAFENMDSALAELGVTPETKRLFDIRLWRGDQEIQPTGSVALTFSGIKNPKVSGEMKVYHIDEEQDIATDMTADMNKEGEIVVETEHFSLYGVALLAEITPLAAGTINENLAVQSATWDPGQKKITALSFNISNTIKDWWYVLQHSSNGGSTWTPPNPTSTGTGTKAASNGVVITANAASSLGSLSMDSVFRAYGYKGNKAGESGYTADISIYQVFDFIKPGFSSWLNNSYGEFGGVPPTTMTGLNEAFAMYYAQPTATLTQALRSGSLWLDMAVTPIPPVGTEYTYHWQYKDGNGVWQGLTADTTASINATSLQTLLAGGKQVRTKVYNGVNLVAISNQLLVDPHAAAIAAAITAINTELNLTSYNIGKGITKDLSIGGHQFNDLFYYGNMARDSRVPFSDAASYSTYLAETYLTGGIDAVRAVWTEYLWDLYDPSFDYGNSNGGSGDGLYPEAGGYGDSTFEWPKDADGTNSSPFHASVAPTIEPLNYNFLENGVDYSNFVTGLHKTAKAAAAGDGNSERLYDIDIVADAQAKIKAPVVLVFQIQTSWQMFDIPHANRLKTDLPVNGTNVGAASQNTELANLYDIKQALLRLINYMESNDLGNNMAVAITDVEHAGAFSMFTGTDSANKTLYITNNFAKLREGIIGWDTFGNCEHIHYRDDTLRAAVVNLQSNLSNWKDIYGNNLVYNDIQKAAVIIGGPTENSTGTSGYGITLPWTNFQTAGLNSVYGIRTNIGTPITAGAPISWIDYSGNNTGTAFKDGTGTKFTDKYVASNEDALFYALRDIVNREMNTKGINVTNGNTYVDDVTVSDTVEKEFFLNKEAAITATIKDANGNTVSTKNLTLAGAQIDSQSNGTVVTTTVDGLVITERPDKTTTLEYNFGQVNNTRKAVLHFQVGAREDYLGSNSVFANVGTPVLDYTHIRSDDGGHPIGAPNIYPVVTRDTPQVNVPIRFNTVDGEAATIMVGGSVNLKDLSTSIVLDAQDRVDNYPQTNGTLSYAWILPNGNEVPAGSVTVTDGIVSAPFPDRSTVFTGTEVGQYTGKLKVTFTPNAVDSANPNFSDAATKTAVNPLIKPGNVWINVVDGNSKTDLIVRKAWPQGGNTGINSVSFHLMANGTPVLGQDNQPRVYMLTAANNWELRLTDLPMTKVVGGVTTVINYTVEETPLLEGFSVAYSQASHPEDVYAAKVTFTITFSTKVKQSDTMVITYSYGGEIKTKTLAANAHGEFGSNTTHSFEESNLLLGTNGQPQSVSITSVKVGNNSVSTNYSAGAVKYVSHTTSVPVRIIANTPAYALPETGGTGTILYTMKGLVLMLGSVLIYGYSMRRRGERRGDF
ncbi:Cna B-type domain-containing protein [Dehalobacterium formicoaceticum]|uniref:Cna B-type domain-containing protein n=1 Tax=Dehalobacterium formicoaceticum TaxID=51515 RepID=UPI0031F5F8C0